MDVVGLIEGFGGLFFFMVKCKFDVVIVEYFCVVIVLVRVLLSVFLYGVIEFFILGDFLRCLV